MRWLPVTDDAQETTAPAAAPDAQRILVADDNADMREYVGRVLRARYRVELVSNGATALAAIRRSPPDLVLTDVMMPELDGFGLLAAIRADPALRDLRVLMLSARAGEESRSEGLEAGADDYLVKPFSARELLARVDAQLVRAQLRSIEKRQAERMRAIFRDAPVGIAIMTGPELRFEFANPRYVAMVGGRQVVGRSFREAFPELEGQGAIELVERVYRTGEPFVSTAYRAVLNRGPAGAPEEGFFHVVQEPLRGQDGRVRGHRHGGHRGDRAGGQSPQGRGGQPGQGRVPGDARPRAPQPARPAGHRPASDEAPGPGDARAGAGDHRAAGEEPLAPGGRPARCLAHRPRQGRAAP